MWQKKYPLQKIRLELLTLTAQNLPSSVLSLSVNCWQCLAYTVYLFTYLIKNDKYCWLSFIYLIKVHMGDKLKWKPASVFSFVLARGTTNQYRAILMNLFHFRKSSFPKNPVHALVKCQRQSHYSSWLTHYPHASVIGHNAVFSQRS